MKKLFSTIILTLMLVMLVVAPASAKSGKINIKGVVTFVDGTTLTVESNKGVTFEVAIPDGFDITIIQQGASVLIKGMLNEDGTVSAQNIMLVGNVSSGDDDVEDPEVDDQDKPEGSKDNSAFCAEGKQEKNHPLALKFAERYGVTEEWVMGHFCEGYSIGAIMLALNTSKMNGVDSEPDAFLAQRREGNSWGHIWSDLGLIGKLKDGQSPPSLLKKTDHVGPENNN
jgi:hypothetical protein